METMLAEATIGDLGEHEFLREIEDLLRSDQVDQALARIAMPMARHCQPGGPLPASLIDLTPDDIELGGWSELEARMREIDRKGYPVTALGIEIADPAMASRDSPQPPIETCFYTDSAYPFSECDREALLEGYSSYGTEWQGSCDVCDATISVCGLEDAWIAVTELGERLRASDIAPDGRDLQAYTLGASYLAALIHAAVRRTVEQRGLTRPLAIFVAADGCYPGFDAPVVTPLDEVRCFVPSKRPAVPEPLFPEPVDPEPYATPTSNDNDTRAEGIQPVESEDDDDFFELGRASEAHPDSYYEMPDTHAHVTGTQLRKRFVTEESIAATQESEPQSLLQRLLGRIKPRS